MRKVVFYSAVCKQGNRSSELSNCLLRPHSQQGTGCLPLWTLPREAEGPGGRGMGRGLQRMEMEGKASGDRQECWMPTSGTRTLNPMPPLPLPFRPSVLTRKGGLPPGQRLIDPPRSLELVPSSVPRTAACFLVSDCKQI